MLESNDMPDLLNIDKLADDLNEIYLTSANSSLRKPSNRGKNKRKHKKWFDHDLLKQRQKFINLVPKLLKTLL